MDIWRDIPALDQWPIGAEQQNRRCVIQGSARPIYRCERLLMGFAGGLFLSHVVLLLAFHNSAKYLSNAVQLVAPVLAMLVCSLRIRREENATAKLLWKQLRVAFLLWMAGQAYWTFALLNSWTLHYPSLADLIWLSFAFPILVVIANTSTCEKTHDRVSWLDLAQGAAGLLILYALVFAPEHFIKADAAYEVQCVTLLLACGLRLSLTKTDLERRFFCDLAIYLGIFGACCLLGNLLQEHGWADGSLADLAWTLPFVAFALLVLRPGRPVAAMQTTGVQKPASALARGLRVVTQSRGFSAVGQTVLSLGAAGLLSMHRPVLGLCALLVVFAIFAARTAIREQELECARTDLEAQALYDPLTGLANRVLLKRQLDVALESSPYGSIAVLTLDLDRFKTINESLGHEFGDRLLIKIAGLLEQAIRPGDLLVRLGGDEFAVLLRDIPSDAAAECIATRIVLLLQKPIELDDRINYLTASVGIARSGDQMNTDVLLRNADCAMHAAKTAGKNGAKMFSPAMQSSARRSLELETELRRALETGGIEAWYQPIYGVNGTEIHGFEALVRWRHPERGMISPGEFIAIAEDTGLILDLGRQVLQQACAHVRDWNGRFGTRLTMSVNISARQFSDAQLLSSIVQILEETGLDPQLLKLEVTESILLSDPTTASEVLTAARALGIQICLDDFGTGYSSLSYLLEFPFDIVKIDRSFVKNMEQDHRRFELVRTIMRLVQQLDKQVIAEGVETEGEMACLRDLNCGLLQGFLLSKPLEPGRVPALLVSATPASTLATPPLTHIPASLFVQQPAAVYPAHSC